MMFFLRAIILDSFAICLLVSNVLSQSLIEGHLTGENSRFERAIDQMRQGNFQNSRTILEDALHADPSNPYLHELLGDVYVKLQDIDKAIEFYTQALQLDPRRFSTYERRGYLCLQCKEWDRAIADYSEAIKIDRNSANCRQGRASAHYGKGLYAKARADLECAFGLGLLKPTAFSLGKLLAVCPDASVRDGIRAIDYAKIACQQTNYADWLSLSFLAAAHAEAGQWDEAIRWSKKALERAQGVDRTREQMNMELYQLHYPLRECTEQWIAKKSPSSAGEALEYAVVKKGLGDHAGAVADYRKAIEMDPRLSAAHSGLGRLIARENLSEAVDHFNRCLKLDPKNVDALSARCLAYFKLGKYREALNDSEVALAWDAKDWSALALKLIALASCGEPERALRELNDVSPEQIGVNVRTFIRGHCYLIQGQFNDAISEFTQAIELYPEDILAYAARAVALSAIGNEKGANWDLEECCRLSPAMRGPTEARMRAAKERPLRP